MGVKIDNVPVRASCTTIQLWSRVDSSLVVLRLVSSTRVCRWYVLLTDMWSAGLFPGCVYLVSCWYVRYEVQTRYAHFSTLEDLSGVTDA